MDKTRISELKEKLEKEKAEIEKQLRSFADKDKNLKGDWDTRFPNWDSGSPSSSNMETAADEVEEYTTLLSVEHKLELKLKDINAALKKIDSGKYGLCEECGKEIGAERLKVTPEARLCMDCQK